MCAEVTPLVANVAAATFLWRCPHPASLISHFFLVIKDSRFPLKTFLDIEEELYIYFILNNTTMNLEDLFYDKNIPQEIKSFIEKMAKDLAREQYLADHPHMEILSGKNIEVRFCKN